MTDRPTHLEPVETDGNVICLHGGAHMYGLLCFASSDTLAHRGCAEAAGSWVVEPAQREAKP